MRVIYRAVKREGLCKSCAVAVAAGLFDFRRIFRGETRSRVITLFWRRQGCRMYEMNFMFVLGREEIRSRREEYAGDRKRNWL